MGSRKPIDLIQIPLLPLDCEKTKDIIDRSWIVGHTAYCKPLMAKQKYE